MRTAILFCLFAVFGYIATAQFSIQPQIGIESFHSKIKYNELSSFSPLCQNPATQLGLRLDYNFKKMHGPWLGIATNKSGFDYSFTDPETGMTNYLVTETNSLVRIEAGYQVKSKPIYLNKSGSTSNEYKGHCTRSTAQSKCGSKVQSSQCGSKVNEAKKTSSKGTWMRVAPSAGFAYLPVGKSSIEEINNGTETRYTYEAGKWGTAVLGGVGFEFGRDDRQAFIFSINYLQGLGTNEQTKNINNVPGNKTVPTTLSSSSSAWSIKLGFPINLSKRKTSAQKEVIVIKEVQKQEYKCGQSKSPYKPRCYRSYNDQ